MRTTETPDRDDLAWLDDAAAPGDGDFAAAARWRVGAMALLVGQWAALVTLVSRAESGGLLLPAVAFALLLVARRVATWRAEIASAAGGSAVAASLRERLVDATLPVDPAAAPPAAERSVQAAVELAADVGRFSAQARPARRAAAWQCAVVLLACALAHWPVAVLLALATPILPINLRLAGMATRDASTRQLEGVRRLSAQVLERFRAMEVLRELGAVEREREQLRASSEELGRRTSVVLRSAFVAAGVLDVVVTLAIAVTATYVGLAGLGFLDLPLAPRPSLWQGLFVLVLAPVFFLPLRDVAAGYHEREKALAAVDVLRPLLDGAETDRRTTDLAAGLAGDRPAGLGLREADLTPRHASEPVLRGVTATARRGRLVAVLGASGAGKTTLLSALGGLLPPTSGAALTLDGSGREQGPPTGSVGWLGQRTVVLAGTLANNVRLGRPDASDDEVAAAAHAVGLSPLVARLPDGLSSPVGDDGFGLSAGEARRVALARAVLADRGVWLLDEPTAHLDPESADAVADLLADLGRDRVVVVATHDPAVARRADEVWRIDRGELLVREAGAPT